MVEEMLRNLPGLIHDLPHRSNESLIHTMAARANEIYLGMVIHKAIQEKENGEIWRLYVRGSGGSGELLVLSATAPETVLVRIDKALGIDRNDLRYPGLSAKINLWNGLCLVFENGKYLSGKTRRYLRLQSQNWVDIDRFAKEYNIDISPGYNSHDNPERGTGDAHLIYGYRCLIDE